MTELGGKKIARENGQMGQRKRKEGVEIKIGRGRVRIAGIWRAWKEIEKKKREKVEGWRDEKREGGGRTRERSLENRDKESVRERKAMKNFVTAKKKLGE